MLIAAFTSRSWTAPQTQIHDRTFNGIDSATAPHAEHILDDANHRSILAKWRP